MSGQPYVSEGQPLTDESESSGFGNRRDLALLVPVQEALPAFLYSKQIPADISEVEDFGDLRTSKVVGPIIRPLVVQNAITMLTQIAIFVAVLLLSTCGEGGQVSYDGWILPLLVPSFLFHNYIELKAVQHYLIPSVSSAMKRDLSRAKKLFRAGGFQVSPTTWFIVSMLISNASVLDVRSDSLVGGATYVSLDCSENTSEQLWSQIWDQSLLGYFGIPPPSLHQCVAVAWFCTLLQYIVPYLLVMRVKVFTRELSYQYGDEGVCKTLCGNPVNHEDVFLQMADGADMATLRSLMVEIADIRFDDAWENRELRQTHLYGIRSLGRQMIIRAVFTWLLEHALQLNIQVTFFALSYSQGHQLTGVLLQTLVSIGLSMGGIFLSISNLRHFVRVCEDNVWKLTESNQDCLQHLSASADKDEVMTVANKVRRLVRILKTCGVMLVLVLIYAICNLAAVFLCKDSL